MGCSNSKATTSAGDGTSTGIDNSKNGNGAPSQPLILTKMQKKVQQMGKTGQHHMRNVFAKPLSDLMGGSTAKYEPPVFPKTDAELQFLKTALPKNFACENMSATELKQLCNAMEQVTAQPGEVVIQQGDEGDFFYVIVSGTCNYVVDDKVVGKAGPGDSFGELALLYSAPRAATVQAAAATGEGEPTEADVVKLYRVDQTVFRYILQQQTVSASAEKCKLLKQVAFLTDLDDFALDKLATVMTPKQFKAGCTIMTKGDVHADLFYILESGSVNVTEIGLGEVKYEDMAMSKPGDYFGERALVTGEPRAATITAVTDTLCFTIDKQTFEAVLGDYARVILKSGDKRILSAIKLIWDMKLTPLTLTDLAHLINDRTWPVGTFICEANKSTVAALYLVRTGTVTIKSDSGETKKVGPGGYFGDDQLMMDVGLPAGRNSNGMMEPVYTAIAAGTEDVTCAVLTLSACRKVLDTRLIGQPEAVSTRINLVDSMMDKDVPLAALKRHTILGAGTFGQVWLVSRGHQSGGARTAYALKVQSKYELCKDGQAMAVVYEKNIMAKLHHPFLIGLVNTYQDDNFVYILLQLVQGGELYSYIHTPKRDFLADDDARFYAACIAEGLGFMHRNGFVYRDLKPENVLIDATGYCVIIDFGFAKYVPLPSKTFTLCGTPLYLPPEVILNRGHNGSADHWSLGILIFEMLTGETPFYHSGMEQMDLFRSIVKCRYTIPKSVSPEATLIATAFLTKDPAQRLGSLAGGEDDILAHPWFKDTIDFDELRAKTIKAPKIPKIKDPLDSSNFENWNHLEDKSKVRFPRLSAEQAQIFKDF